MLNMLVVEDNIYFSKLLINKTIQFNKNLRLSMIATDGKEVLEIINREKIDIILLDMNIPGYNGLEILNFLARNKKEEYLNSIIATSCKQDVLDKIENNPLVYDYISENQGLDAIIEKVNNISKYKEEMLKKRKTIQKKKKVIKNKIQKELINLGYNGKYIGTEYMSESIYYMYFLKDKAKVKLEKDIYPIIVEKNSTTVNTVKCDIIKATNHLENDANEIKLKEYFGYFLDRKIRPKLVMRSVLNKIKQEI